MGDLGSQEWELCSNVSGWRLGEHGLEKQLISFQEAAVLRRKLCLGARAGEGDVSC